MLSFSLDALPNGKFPRVTEKKRSQSWMKKQVSRQMSWEYDFSSSDYPTAIAAAAYAVQSLEESSFWDKKERENGHDKSLSKTNSRVDKTEEKPEPLLKSALKSSGERGKSRVSLLISQSDSDGSVVFATDETSKSSFKDEGIGKRLGDKRPTKKLSFADMDEINIDKAEKLPFQKAPERAPSLKRPEAALPKPEQRLPTRMPTAQPVQSTALVARRPGPEDSAADAWEKEELISIKERYDFIHLFA